MRAFASRILDARHTVEGKIISVLLSVLLAAMCFNVAVFTNEAAADDDVAGDATAESTTEAPAANEVPTPVIDVEDAIGDITVDVDDASSADADADFVDDSDEAVISTMALSEEEVTTEEAEEPIDCAFTMEKIADGEYLITGEGVFAGEFVYEGELSSWQSHALGYMAIKKLTLGEGITAIAAETFTDSWVSRSMQEIVLPTTLTTIGAKAFRDGYLQKINLDHVTSIGAEAFASNGNPGFASVYGSGITELTVPASLAYIGERAFHQMMGLKKLTIKEGVASIGANAFEGCRALERIELPYSLNAIEKEAFSGCNALTTISMNGESAIEGTAHIAGVNTIGVGALNGVNMTNLVLDDISTIGNGSNSVTLSCPSLKSVTLNNVETASAYAFYWSPALENVQMNNVGSIGKLAFYNCNNLQEVSLTNITTIGEQAFYGYNGTWVPLKKVTIDGASTIDKYAFGYNYYLNELSLNNIGTIGQYAFYYCGTLPKIEMGKVNVINPYAFMSCSKLETIDSLKNVNRIDGFAFYGCANLKGLTIEDATKMGFNGNYGDVMDRIEKILQGKFKLDSAKGITQLEEEAGWTDTAYNADEKWNTYDNGTQIMQQARWAEGTNQTVAEVKVDAYFTAKKQMDYVFVADLSASMAQLGNAKDQNSRFYDMQSKMLDVASSLLGSEGYDCKVAFVVFGGAFNGNNGTVKPTHFISSVDEAEAFIKGLEPYYENTDYKLGLNEAQALVSSNSDRATSIVFLSDGQPTMDGANGINDDNRSAYIEAISDLANSIKDKASIYGVLQSVADSERAGAEEAMRAICSDGLFFQSTDTESFSNAINLAISAVYPKYTITIPIGEDFQNVQNVTVSTQAGSAHYDIDSRSIIWTIEDGMPFTKHTLTFNETLRPDRVALTGTNNFLNTATGTTTLGTSVNVDGKTVNIIRSTVLVRTNNPVVPTPTPTPDPTPTPTPVPPVVPGPGTPVVPAGVVPPAPVPEDITDDATPMAQNPEGEEEGEEEEIVDDENPLGAFDVKHCWTHWLMLMGMLLTAAYGIAVARRRSNYSKDLDDFEKSVTGQTAKKRGTVTVPNASHQAI